MRQCRFNQPVHGDVWLDERHSPLSVHIDDIAKRADVHNALFVIETRAVGRAVEYPERLLACKILFDFGGYLCDNALVAVHERCVE